MAVVSGTFKLYQGVVGVLVAIMLGVGTIIGAQIGARTLRVVPSWLVKAIFGGVFLYVSVRFIWQAIAVLQLIWPVNYSVDGIHESSARSYCILAIIKTSSCTISSLDVILPRDISNFILLTLSFILDSSETF